MHFVVLLSALVVCAAADPLNSTNPRIGARIVGGDNAPFTSIKYTVSLHLEDGSLYCGGAIVGHYWVITAAQCVYTNQLHHILAGSRYPLEGTWYFAKQTFFHTSYNPATYDYDIGLVNVNKKIQFDGITVGSIPFHFGPLYPEKRVDVFGWGSSSPNGVSDKLQCVNVKFIPTGYCKRRYKNTFPEKIYCAIKDEGGVTNEYDIGGPVVLNDHIVGIVSQTPKCTRDPDVYTSFSEMMTWILSYSPYDID